MEEEISFIPRICGPVLFNVLLSFRRDRATARQRRDEAIIDGLSDQDLLAGLIRIGRLSFKPLADSSFKTDTSNYKKCKGDEYASIPITTEVYISTFNEEFKNNYQALLKSTNHAFVKHPSFLGRPLRG